MNQATSLPIVGICAGGSNAGKTTLITQLVTEFARRNMRVSVVKHAHHHFDIDYPGKDSFKIREAGAVQTLIASSKRWALMTEMTRTPDNNDEADLNMLLAELNPNYADLILVEGFKNAEIAKIEVYRDGFNLPLLALQDSNIIAVASDKQDLNLSIPTLDLNNIHAITDFITTRFIS